MTLPLEGIRVLDLSRLLPGPFCSWILADFGAEVLRVEEPLDTKGRRAELSQGVTRRAIFTPDEPSKVRPYDCLSRNKKSIILNLKNEKAQAIVHQMAQQMDIFLEEFRPGVVKRLGVDYETIKQINPQIIYCSISLYGQDGPYHHLPGHDPCALSVAGAIGLSTAEGENPKPFGVPVADVLTGLHAIISILLALRAREVTGGKGQYIDISMTDSALDLLCLASQPYFRKGVISKINRKNPSSGVWETKDGRFICTTNMEAHHWANFCRIIGREDFIPYQYDREKREGMYHEIKEIFLTKDRDEWLQVLQGELETQAAPLHRDLNEVFSDPQVLHRKMVTDLNHPDLGMIKQLGTSINLSETPGKIRSLAPLPGEHTEEVLTRLGYSKKEINELRKEGVLG